MIQYLKSNTPLRTYFIHVAGFEAFLVIRDTRFRLHTEATRQPEQKVIRNLNIGIVIICNTLRFTLCYYITTAMVLTWSYYMVGGLLQYYKTIPASLDVATTGCIIVILLASGCSLMSLSIITKVNNKNMSIFHNIGTALQMQAEYRSNVGQSCRHYRTRTEAYLYTLLGATWWYICDSGGQRPH